MKSNSGFTLIEVLVTTVLIGAAIGLAMDASRVVSWSRSYSKNTEIARRVAITQLEELLSTSPADFRLNEGEHTRAFDREGRAIPDSIEIANMSGGPTASTAQIPTAFTARWNVKRDNPISQILRIELFVTWDVDGHPHTVHYLTFRKF